MSLLKPKRPIRLTIEQKFFYSCGLSRALLTQVFRICEQNHPVLRLDGVGLLFERRPHSEDPLACSVLLQREKNVSVSQRCLEIPLQLICVGESDTSTGKAFFLSISVAEGEIRAGGISCKIYGRQISPDRK